MAKYTVKAFVLSGRDGAGKAFEMTISDDDETLDYSGQDEGEKEIAHIDGKEHAIEGSNIYRVTYTTDDGEKISEDMVISEVEGVGKVLIPAEEGSKFSTDSRILEIRSEGSKEGIEHEKLAEAAGEDDEDEKGDRDEGDEKDDKDDEDGDDKDDRDEKDQDEKDGHEEHGDSDEEPEDSGQVRFTVEAYKFVGAGPYGESVEMTITDDDGTANWFSQEEGGKEQVEIDGNSYNVYGTGIFKLSFVTEDGEEATEDFIFQYAAGQGWMFLPAEEDSKFSAGSKVTKYHGWQDTDGVEYDSFVHDHDDDDHDDDDDDDDDPVCFVTGTLIATPEGARPVEDLRPGDLVLTADHGAQPVLWCASSPIPAAGDAAPSRRPICIRAGAFGPGRPARDLLLSPQHRVLLRAPLLALCHGVAEALAPVHALAPHYAAPAHTLPEGARYHHILLPAHAVLLANGLPCESLYPGGVALASLGRAARRRLFAALPALAADPALYGPTARLCLTARESRALLRLANMQDLAHGPAEKTLPDPARAPHFGFARG